MSITLSKFQENASNAAYEAFKNNNMRYLIADETGLGKTIIARDIIDKLKEQKESLVVFYFGSNLMLLENTINEKLKKGTDWEYKNTPDRLGMMVKEDIIREEGKVKIYGFSANLIGGGSSKGKGSVDSKNLNYERPYYKNVVSNPNNPKEKFSKYAEELRNLKLIDENEENGVKNLIEKRKWDDNEDITPIRRLFEIITLKNKKYSPDLIIFDEFHRYDDRVVDFCKLIGNINRINSVNPIKILFLSATPYNYYPELNGCITSDVEMEDDEDNDKGGRKIRNFKALLDMLNPDLNAKYDEYKNGTINSEEFSGILKKKCIYRNERLSDGDQKYLSLPTIDDYTKEDFSDCFLWESELVDLGREKRFMRLCSGVYSFPLKVYKENGKSDFYDALYSPNEVYQLPEEYFIFDSAGKLKRTKEYWNNLRLKCIEYYNAEKGRDLLWVPPSIPEYPLEGKYKTTDFSKLMIFSAYKMVPRAISGIFSSYVSDDVNITAEENIDLTIIDENVNKCVKPGRTKELALLYTEALKEIGKELFSEEKHSVERLCEKVEEILKRKQDDLFEKPEEADLKLIAKYVIGSPYFCALRVFEDDDKAEQVRVEFNEYFKKEGIRQAIVHCGIKNSEGLLVYCIEGGLNAVLREYKFAGGDADHLIRALQYGIYDIDKVGCDNEKKKNACSQVHVYTKETYIHLQEPLVIKCHYAERFNADFTDTGETDTAITPREHFSNCHNAFNSPFWPMILCTTSANQEGYDLDRYCNRIMHYSLPKNTMSFEQRDGRIDRRLSLLARRRMAQLYSSDYDRWDPKLWETIFSNNNNEDDSGMSPYWTQKGYIDEARKKGYPLWKLERVIPYFPMTAEHVYYKNLLNNKNKYRGHFGLPNESDPAIETMPQHLKLNDI